MREHRSAINAKLAWHVPVAVEDIPDGGAHFELAADAEVRDRVARMAGLRDVTRLQASFDLLRQGGGGLHVTGQVRGTVGQTCVVTLEPLINEIDEAVDLVFVPQPELRQRATDGSTKDEPREVDWDEPEHLVGGKIDLGAIAAEFLILGIDPYPRKPGAVFEPAPELSSADGPFSALAGLKGKTRDSH